MSSEDETVEIWREGFERLRSDEAFGPLVREVGPIVVPRPASDPFPTLVRAIVYQQLAGKAAATIHGRVVDVLGGKVSPERVLATDGDDLRGAGLSRSKLRAIRDLSEHVAGKGLDLSEMAGKDDDDVVRSLTRVWGIGPWTARMHLMFYLQRPDVWPVGDLGVRSGWARIHEMARPPDADALEPLGDRLRPWRSAAAWYCWRAVELLPEP